MLRFDRSIFSRGPVLEDQRVSISNNTYNSLNTPYLLLHGMWMWKSRPSHLFRFDRLGVLYYAIHWWLFGNKFDSTDEKTRAKEKQEIVVSLLLLTSLKVFTKASSSHRMQKQLPSFENRRKI